MSSSGRLYYTSRGPSINRFFERYLRLPTGKYAGQPFRPEPWQAAFNNYFHQLDEHGNRVFRLGILGIPRGNGKSPLTAGTGLYELLARRDRPHIYCISASKDLAAIVHGFARSFVENGPLQKHGVRSGRKQITYDRGGGFFEALPASGSLAHGRNPATFIGDELWALTTAVQKETWVAMYTALHKRENPYALGITTAGWDRATLLGETYDEALAMPPSPIAHTNPCLRIHEDRDAGVLFWWYGIPEDRQGEWDNPELWRAANPATWIELEALRKQLAAPGFSEFDFMRLHLNMWTGAKDVWMPTGIWADLVSDERFPKNGPIWVGVDVGWTDDSTAVVWVTRRPNGRIVIRAKVWTTREDQPGTFVPGGVMRLDLVEDFILTKLKPRYRIRELAYDPSYFGRSAQILANAGVRNLVEMPPMHAHTVASWELFKQLAIDGVLEHDGDAILAAHVGNAATVLTANGPRVRKNESGKIDALAAAVLAVSRCELKTAPRRNQSNVFWMNLDNDTPGAEPVPDDEAE